MKKRVSLRFRFLILLIGLLFVVFAAITLTIVSDSSKTLRTDLVDESRSFALLATQPIGNAFEIYQNSGTLLLQQEVRNYLELDPHINQVEIVDTTGKRLFVNGPTLISGITTTMAASLNPTYIDNKRGNLEAIVQPYTENYGIHRYTVIYGVSYQSVNQSIQSIVTSIIILSIIILVMSLLLGYLLINRIFLRPVASVSRLALKISKGDFSQQSRLKRNDEIGDLATAVDIMASSLKDDIDKLKQLDTMKNEFMMIASHNLRTPLTIVEGYVDTLQRMVVPSEVKEALGPIAMNVNRLRGFAEDVLTISTIEAGNSALKFEPTPILPLLQSIANEFAKQAAQKHVQFQYNLKTNSSVNLSKPHFRSALWNLLDNAYKFTPAGGSIALITHDNGIEVQISVRDTGTGIAAAEIPQLFTKFHRATGTLKYDYEGTGIGLYISKLIIEQHGGKISVQSAEGAGSTFTISLPTVTTAALRTENKSA
jgi:signal transduction histidine kinase